MKRQAIASIALIAIIGCATNAQRARLVPNHIDLEGTVTTLKYDNPLSGIGMQKPYHGTLETASGPIEFKGYGNENYDTLRESKKHNAIVQIECRRETTPCFVNAVVQK